MQNQETNTPKPETNSDAIHDVILKLNNFDKAAIAIDRPLKFGGWIVKLVITGIAAGLGTVAVNTLVEAIKAHRQRNKTSNVLKVAGQ